MRPPAEIWETLAEIEHELLTAEMNAERLEDSVEPDTAKPWRRREAELRAEFDAYAAKHGVQFDHDDEYEAEETHR